MAFKAPLHLKRLDLPGERHQVNAAMTSRATHTFIDMYAVIEINEVGQVVDSRPFYRLARREAFTHGSQIWAVRPELRMAIHACLGRRDTRES